MHVLCISIGCHEDAFPYGAWSIATIKVVIRDGKFTYCKPLIVRVFSRDIVLGGGGCFCGERKCEEYPKNKRNLLFFGGEIQNLGGGNFPPLKALKKTLLIVSLTVP